MNGARRLAIPALSILAAIALICLPLGARSQQTQPAQQDPSQQTQTQQPAQTPAQTQPQAAPQQPSAPPDDTPPDSSATPPGVKKSRDDVNKIGERGVGKGVNFYSLEREIALPQVLWIAYLRNQGGGGYPVSESSRGSCSPRAEFHGPVVPRGSAFRYPLSFLSTPHSVSLPKFQLTQFHALTHSAGGTPSPHSRRPGQPAIMDCP